MYKVINTIYRLSALVQTQCLRRHFFGGIGKKTIMYQPLRIVNPRNIVIGSNVVIEKGSTLYSVKKYSAKLYNGKISIGDRVYINYGFNATAACSVCIEDDVLIGFNVSIFDFNHDYHDITKNINNTELLVKGPVIIGEKSWIGMNTSILGNVRIGKHCVIAANSVVTRDVDDYCVVAGNPAVLIKNYNHITKKWEEVNE